MSRQVCHAILPLFAVAEGWLLLDFGWFVFFLTSKGDATRCVDRNLIFNFMNFIFSKLGRMSVKTFLLNLLISKFQQFTNLIPILNTLNFYIIKDTRL